ncbi:MAG: hypothetical protein RL308_2785 [Bacteroidota bacterium]|jgi:hypothetical protein
MSENETTELLNAWQSNIDDAMNKVHEKFCGNTKFILTESDLKCWLFYELQNLKPYIPYAVHTEVTHYAKHTDEKEKLEKKYKFRDLSLLCPWLIRDNEEIWDETTNEILYNKGFKHNGPAIHFELKYVRQGISENSIPNIAANDILKLQNYRPQNSSHERHFVIVWGSRSESINVNELEGKLRSSLSSFNNQYLNRKLDFYLFDKKSLKHFSWQQNTLVEIKK